MHRWEKQVIIRQYFHEIIACSISLFRELVCSVEGGF
jgi:hypothetical protein